MNTKSSLPLCLCLLFLSLAGRAQAEAGPFPEVGKRYHITYATKEENPFLRGAHLAGQSTGQVTILRNAGNGWVEVEYLGSTFDQEKNEFVLKKQRLWLNFAKASTAAELKAE